MKGRTFTNNLEWTIERINYPETTMEENILKLPAPFTGDWTRIKAFIVECNLYMTVKQNIYKDDLSKIVFMLSLMTDKEACQWKGWFLRSITDDQMNLKVPTIKYFVGLLLDPFSVRGHPHYPIPIMKPDNHGSDPALTSIPTHYIPPHRRVYSKNPIVT